MKVGEYSRKDI